MTSRSKGPLDRVVRGTGGDAGSAQQRRQSWQANFRGWSVLLVSATTESSASSRSSKCGLRKLLQTRNSLCGHDAPSSNSARIAWEHNAAPAATRLAGARRHGWPIAFLFKGQGFDDLASVTAIALRKPVGNEARDLRCCNTGSIWEHHRPATRPSGGYA